MKKVALILACMLLLSSVAFAVPASNAYSFSVDGKTIGGTLLTDFTDGAVVGTASGYGTYSMKVEEGKLKMACTDALLVESGGFYGGGNIATADAANAVYVGFSVTNHSASRVLVAFQSTRGTEGNTTNVRITEAGSDKILIVNSNGQVANATTEITNGRVGYSVPAGFSGRILLPVTRISTTKDAAPNWATGTKQFYRLGFYLKATSGGGSIDIEDVFVATQGLPAGTDILASDALFTNDAPDVYSFTADGQSILGEVLTDFTDGSAIAGQINGTSIKLEGGKVIMSASGSNLIESYGLYQGGNIGSAATQTASYIGFHVNNVTESRVIVAFQGTRGDDKRVRMYQTGDDILIVRDDGKIAKATTMESNGRVGYAIPAGFSGRILLPVTRISQLMGEAPDWNSFSKTLKTLGFYVKATGGGANVEFDHFFVVTQSLPDTLNILGSDAEFDQIENPDYTYTDDERIAAFWNQGTMYNESITMMQRDGEITAHTLFVPTRIIAIADYSLKKEFVEGVDYEWDEGTNVIRWLPGSDIKYFFTGALSGLKEEGGTEYVKDYYAAPMGMDESGRCRLGGVLYSVSAFVYERQVAITYEYNLADAKERVKKTNYQGEKVSRFVEKLENEEPVNILFYGSSSFQGGDASAFHGRDPFMPILSDLFGNYINDNITETHVTNLGVGGWNTAVGLAALKGEDTYTTPSGGTKPVTGRSGALSTTYKDTVAAGDYDLVVMGFFAGNDYGSGITPAMHKDNMQAMMDEIRAGNPNCEFLFLGGFVTNPGETYSPGYNTQIKNLAGDEHIYVHTYEIHKSILQYKDYIATSGNNINHGNDWFIRVMAQNMLAAVIDGFGGEDWEEAPAPTTTPAPSATAAPQGTDKPGGTGDSSFGVYLFAAAALVLAVAAGGMVTRKRQNEKK